MTYFTKSLKMVGSPLEFGADLALWLDSQVGITRDVSDRVTSWISRDVSVTEFTRINDYMEAVGRGIALGSKGHGHSITFRGFFERLTTSTNLTICSHTNASSFFRLHGKNRCDFKGEGATDYLVFDTLAEVLEDKLYTITISISPAFRATLYIDGVAQVDKEPVLPVFILDKVMAKNISHLLATYKELNAAEVLQLHEYLKSLY